ncbi:MAG: DUF2950 family protein [Planctomycetes bacterium]|nr:DUF2950 family protein [Planctomycetota bacterium]
MRKHLAVILGLILLVSGLVTRAEDKQNQPEKPSVQWSIQDAEPYCPECTLTVEIGTTKCQYCSAEFSWSEPKFDNKPEGALFKFRCSIKSNNIKLFKEVSVEEKIEAYKDRTLSPCVIIKTEKGDNDQNISLYFVVSEKEGCRHQKASLIKENETWKVAAIADTKAPKRSDRMEANETVAIGSLKAIHAGEATWRQTSMSGTGKTDYWTYDVSTLYRMLKGGTPSAYITLDLAKADVNCHPDDSIANGITQDWNVIKSTCGPKAGYWIKALKEYEPGKPYNQNFYAGTNVACANDYRFGFCAFPAEYGVSGIRTFILNEQGIIYYKDLGPITETRVNRKVKTTPEQEKALSALIKQLGADDWEVREKAQETLTKMGKTARELLEKEKDAKDPEVKMRVNLILKNIAAFDKKGIPGGIDCWPTADPTTKGWKPSGN